MQRKVDWTVDYVLRGVLELGLIVGAVWLARRLAMATSARTGSFVLAAIVFLLVAPLPFADMIPGYFALQRWEKTHPAMAVYERHAVEGLLVERASPSLAADFIGGSSPYAYVEMLHQRAPPRYMSYFYTEPSDSRCPAPSRPAPCLANEPVDQLRSRFSYEISPPLVVDPSPGLLRIDYRVEQVREIGTGRVIAESWRGFYVPWLVRIGHLGGRGLESSGRALSKTFRLRDVLSPPPHSN
jgi:hypothetical protein